MIFYITSLTLSFLAVHETAVAARAKPVKPTMNWADIRDQYGRQWSQTFHTVPPKVVSIQQPMLANNRLIASTIDRMTAGLNSGNKKLAMTARQIELFKKQLDETAKQLVSNMDLTQVFANKDICPPDFTQEMCQQASGRNSGFYLWLRMLRQRGIIKHLEKETAKSLQQNLEQRLINWNLINKPSAFDPRKIILNAIATSEYNGAHTATQKPFAFKHRLPSMKS